MLNVENVEWRNVEDAECQNAALSFAVVAIRPLAFSAFSIQHSALTPTA
jgi:hypothetical protein